MTAPTKPAAPAIAGATSQAALDSSSAPIGARVHGGRRLGNTTNTVSNRGAWTAKPIKPEWFNERDEALRDRSLNHFLFQASLNDDGEWEDGERWANCGRIRVSASDDSRVQAKISDQGVAHLSGYQMCGSVWACPQCGAKIRRHRGDQIADAMRKWLAMGGRCYMVTPTMWHHKGMALDETFGAIMGAWRSAFQGRAKEELIAMGYAGFVRAFDLTVGEHGWHPHIHAVIFIHSQETADQEDAEAYAHELRNWEWDVAKWHEATDGLETADEMVEAAGLCPARPLQPARRDMSHIEELNHERLGLQLDYYFRTKWDGWMKRNGYRGLAQSGLMVDVIKDEAGIGQYVSKASFELTRSDKKKGRKGGLNQWELLREARSTGDVELIRLWKEYCQVTKGRRCIEWSRNGIKKRLVGIGDDDPDDTDEEIVKRETDDRPVALLGPNLAKIAGMQVLIKIAILRAIERNGIDGLRYYLEHELKRRVVLQRLEYEGDNANAPPPCDWLIDIVGYP